MNILSQLRTSTRRLSGVLASLLLRQVFPPGIQFIDISEIIPSFMGIMLDSMLDSIHVL